MKVKEEIVRYHTISRYEINKYKAARVYYRN